MKSYLRNKKWLDFLLFVNEEPENKELLASYYFYQFAASPRAFYGFVRFVKQTLLRLLHGHRKKAIARRYLAILSQLCERFGIFEEKIQLDDLCFKICHDKEYRAIDRLLASYQKKSEKLIARIIEALKREFKKKQIECDIKGRYKSIYSIFRKLRKKSLYSHQNTVLDLHDIFAFRIILKKTSKKDCFEVLNLLHDRFTPLAGHFKDYVSIPKINGYQSLHTGLNGVLPDLDLPIEVQIRTKAMDKFAERGLAAHWLYSEDKKSKLITEKEERLIQHMNTAFTNEQDKKIYVFSHRGDVFPLRPGSSALDFAYHIHTQLGLRTKGARVNNLRVSPSHILREGDRIEIL